MEQASHFGFLASAIAGRRMAVQASCGDEALAWCDGQVIVLPSAASEPWRAVVAQALLVAAGSLDGAVVRRLIGRPGAARQYALLEVLRALTLFAARTPSAFADHPALRGRPAPTHSADQSATQALARRCPVEIPDFIGCVRPLATLRTTIARDGLAALGGQAREGEAGAPALSEQDESEGSSALRLLANPFGGSQSMIDTLGKLLGMARGRGDRVAQAGEGSGAEIPVARIERAWQRGIHAVRAALPLALAETDTRATTGVAYPEWDVHRQAYRKQWAWVDEAEPWRASGPLDLGQVLAPAPHELQRQLSRLGLDFEMHRRQRDGSEFDAGRLIDCAIDLAAGHSPPTLDIYRASRRTRRDLGAVVMVDISGSTEEMNARGESIFEHHLRVAYQLARALDRLGDRVALYGYQSWGRKQVRMSRLKGHEERWSGRVAQRCAHLEPLGYTRSGAAIRHAERVLRSEMRLPNRLLILITDGLSYDQDYEGTYAEQDTRKALAEAAASGTACVCVCIGGSLAAAKLAEVFGAANLLLIDDAGQLPRRIRQACADALAAVSHAAKTRSGGR